MADTAFTTVALCLIVSMPSFITCNTVILKKKYISVIIEHNGKAWQFFLEKTSTIMLIESVSAVEVGAAASKIFKWAIIYWGKHSKHRHHSLVLTSVSCIASNCPLLRIFGSGVLEIGRSKLGWSTWPARAVVGNRHSNGTFGAFLCLPYVHI